MMNCYSMTTRWEFGHEVEKPKLCTSGWQSTTRMPMTKCMLAWHSTIRTSMTSSMIEWHDALTTVHIHWAQCTLSRVVLSSSSCGLFALILPFYFLLYLPSPFPLPQPHEVYGKLAQLLRWGCGRLWRPPPLHRRVVDEELNDALWSALAHAVDRAHACELFRVSHRRERQCP